MAIIEIVLIRPAIIVDIIALDIICMHQPEIRSKLCFILYNTQVA